jgi:transposase-like protein
MRVSMEAKELKTYRLALKVLDGKLTIKEFSELIGKSYRQSQRIIKSVKEKDYFGVIHGNRGRSPVNKTSDSVEGQIKDWLDYKYNGFNITHFIEMVKSTEQYKELPKKSTVHAIAKKHGLVKNPRRAKRRSFKPRARMPSKGMLIQLDGSEHVWFGDHKSDLIAAIDDATGEILSAEFFYGEKSLHSMKVIKKLVDNYGLPEAFYMDQAGIYGKLDRDWESQISRAFDQVGIRLILASSPQAKGRVERLFRTLQDRLIAEMSFYDIKTLDEANEFLKGFIKRFNNQFGVPAQEDPSFRKNVFGDLNLIFCKKETRKIYTGNIFSYEAVTWLIDKKACYRGRYMNINTHVDGSQSFDIMGKKMYPRPVKTMRVYRNKRRVG